MAAKAGRQPLRREAIIDAARTLIRKEGAEALSLRRLATHLGVTAPALYAHIQGKRDLLRAVAAAEFERLIERMESISDPDPLARLAAYSHAYVDQARDDPELFRVLFLFAPAIGAATLPEEVELPAATRAFAIPLAAVEEAMASGAIEGADPLVVALTLWTSTHGVAVSLQLGVDLPADVERQVVDETISRIIRGWRA